MPKRVTFLVKLIILNNFSKVAGSKIEFIHMFCKVFEKWIHSHVFFKVFAKSLRNLAHDLGGRFYKPKLLLAANRLIHLNVSITIPKIHGPRSP